MKVTKSVTAANQFSSSIMLKGLYNMSISGTWVATITLQRSFDGGLNYIDVANFTSNIEDVKLASSYDPTECIYRIGCKTGNYTSGTAVCILAQ